MVEEANAEQEFSSEDYFSLLELLDKLGKDGVAELVSKGMPHRITRGDMIFFLKSDVNRILGENLLEDSDSIELIVDDQTESEVHDLLSQLIFKQSLVKRFEVGHEEEVYKNRILDLSNDIVFGRSQGDPRDCRAFKDCGIVSSVHGKLFLDEDCNLLYENVGANKSKIRGWKDKKYTVLDKDEIGVLVARESLESLLNSSHALMASVKIGFQVKPHFIIRVYISSRNSKKKES